MIFSTNNAVRKLHTCCVALALSTLMVPLKCLPRESGDHADSFRRMAVTKSIKALGRINTPEGIDELKQLSINGIKQWVSIRGLNRDNPVLLFIHGGPGSPSMPLSWAFQKPWEDFFTVVQWDQRGAGKNWNYTNKKQLGPTETLDQLVSDSVDLTAYLRRTLHKDKIVVLGWSYGTTIGVQLIKRKPSWVSAYIGIGQTTAGDNSEAYIYQQLLLAAERRGNVQALTELRAIEPYPNPAVSNDVKHIMLVRKWVAEFNGSWYGHSGFELMSHLVELSPQYTNQDVKNYDTANMWVINALVNNGAIEPAQIPESFDVPVILMMGRYDLQTPYSEARNYFTRLQAPYKKFITFERSAHFVMFEQPGLVLKTLIDEVLPRTEGMAQFQELSDVPD